MLDNVFIERLWRSLKYENVYLNAYETGSEAKAGIGKWITFTIPPVLTVDLRAKPRGDGTMKVF
jgi:hypothetical protein